MSTTISGFVHPSFKVPILQLGALGGGVMPTLLGIDLTTISVVDWCPNQ